MKWDFICCEGALKTDHNAFRCRNIITCYSKVNISLILINITLFWEGQNYFTMCNFTSVEFLRTNFSSICSQTDLNLFESKINNRLVGVILKQSQRLTTKQRDFNLSWLVPWVCVSTKMNYIIWKQNNQRKFLRHLTSYYYVCRHSVFVKLYIIASSSAFGMHAHEKTLCKSVNQEII